MSAESILSYVLMHCSISTLVAVLLLYNVIRATTDLIRIALVFSGFLWVPCYLAYYATKFSWFCFSHLIYFAWGAY